MQENWLHIVGIGENGLADLLPATQAVVQTAEVIIGGDRHGDLIGALSAEHHAWPEGFGDLMALIDKMKGRRVVVLATGDPLWFSIGARIGRAIDPAQIAKTMGKMSPAPNVSVINCCDELMKPNSAPNTSALASV